MLRTAFWVKTSRDVVFFSPFSGILLDQTFSRGSDGVSLSAPLCPFPTQDVKDYPDAQLSPRVCV